jgi:hypothetical protein
MSLSPIAEHYRERAARYRRLAEEATDPAMAERLRQVAEFYDALAPTADEAERSERGGGRT